MADQYLNYRGSGGPPGGAYPVNVPNFSVPPPAIPNADPYYKSADTYRNVMSGDKDYDNRGGNGNAGGTSNLYRSGGIDKGGYNKGGNVDADLITQEDTIFVAGMNADTTEDDIAAHFGAIGIIKKDKKTMKPKIWLYKNKDSGDSKGEATVTYDDPSAAKSAISWFDGRDFNGASIRVSLAQRQNNWKQGMSGGRGGGGYGGRGGRFGERSDDRGRGGGGRSGGIPQRDGDWNCDSCTNKNFAWRNECNRCHAPKSDTSGGGTGGGAGGSASSYGADRRGHYSGSERRVGGGGYGGGNNDRSSNSGGGGNDRGSYAGGSGRGAFNGGRRENGPRSGERNDRSRPY